MQMYCLSSSISDSRVVPKAGEHFPWNVEGICTECGMVCVCNFFTPPQSPAARGFDPANREVNPSTQIVSYTDTPHYPYAPPSTPIIIPSQQAPIQLWSSDVYKTTINFPPSELPEHLRDGSWCHMLPRAEQAILFGPHSATPFRGTPSEFTIQPNGRLPAHSIETRFFWGPLDINTPLPPSRHTTSPTEHHVCDQKENMKTPLSHTANSFGPCLDSEAPVSENVEA